MGLAPAYGHNRGYEMSQDREKPLRLFMDPFAAWRELALKTAQMIAASAQAGAARAARVRVAVIKEPERPPKAIARKKHKKRAKRR